MTTLRPDDIVRRYLLDRAIDGPPPDLLARSLSRTAAARQKQGWRAARRRLLDRLPLSQRRVRLLSVGLVAIGLLGGFALGGALSGGPADLVPPTASPSEPSGVRVDTFIRPFAWTPMDPAHPNRILPYRGLMDPEVYHWLDEAASAHPGTRNGSQAAGKYGVAIASAGKTSLIGCVGADNLVSLRQSPANLLWDLRSLGGIGLGPERSTTLDGRPALFVDLEPAQNLGCAADIRVTKHLSYESLNVGLPSRMIVADVDGATVIVQIWAKTADDLVAWLPYATGFVDDIRFDRAPGLPLASMAPQRIQNFGVPFDYTPIAGGQIGPAVHSLAVEVFHWVDDPQRADPDGNRNGAQRFGAYGVAIAYVRTPTIEHCLSVDEGNLVLSRDPAALLADLRGFVGAGLGPERPSTLDGWPALVADLDPAANRNGCDKIRLNSVLELGDYLALTLPSRFIVANIDGLPVIVQIWARTPEGLAEWMPAASRFVEDIQFLAYGWRR